MTTTDNYLGWSYQPWDEVMDDNIKTWHDFVHKDGRTATCDFSPYYSMTSKDIKLWIDLGMPERIDTYPTTYPLNSRDLEGLHNLNRWKLTGQYSYIK